MKKIILATILLMSVKCFSQIPGNATITLTGGDWSFIIGLFDARDSTSIVPIKRISDTLKAAAGNFNTQVRVSGVPLQFLYDAYGAYRNIPAVLYDQAGTNIATQIKAISNSPFQTLITQFDQAALVTYQQIRRRGKNIAID